MSPIVVDVGARLVKREGADIHLAPKAFDLLLILVKNQPNAVRHEQLRAALWPGVHVSETSLPALVTQLRRALGDATDDGRLIRTVHRVGYAFAGTAVTTGRASAAAVPVCRLIWRQQPIEVPPGESMIGRGRECAVRIDADSVSRHHARLITTGRDISIEDLGSKNGTWVGGERIHDAVPLGNGVSFRVGSEMVRVEVDDERPTKTVG